MLTTYYYMIISLMVNHINRMHHLFFLKQTYLNDLLIIIAFEFKAS